MAMFPLCFGMYHAGLVNEGFLVISTACNAWMLKEAVRFWKHQGAQGSARGLFWASVWQLPLVLVGALVCKTGIWDGFLGRNEDLDEIDLIPVEEEEGLNMHEAVLKDASGSNHVHNLAMLGFKRPG